MQYLHLNVGKLGVGLTEPSRENLLLWNLQSLRGKAAEDGRANLYETVAPVKTTLKVRYLAGRFILLNDKTGKGNNFQGNCHESSGKVEIWKSAIKTNLKKVRVSRENPTIAK